MVRTLELKMDCLNEEGFVGMCELLAFCCRKNPRFPVSQRDEHYRDYSRPCGMIFQCPLYKCGKGCQEITKEDWMGAFKESDENRN